MRHEVNNLESSVVVQELEFAINRALYGLLSVAHCLSYILFFITVDGLSELF